MQPYIFYPFSIFIFYEGSVGSILNTHTYIFWKMSQGSDVKELRPRPELHWTPLNDLEHRVRSLCPTQMPDPMILRLNMYWKACKCKANSILMSVVGCGVWVSTFWLCSVKWNLQKYSKPFEHLLKYPYRGLNIFKGQYKHLYDRFYKFLFKRYLHSKHTEHVTSHHSHPLSLIWFVFKERKKNFQDSAIGLDIFH